MNMLTAFQNYFRFFQKNLGWQIYLVMLCTFTAALAESVGILLFIPVIGQFGISSEIVSDENVLISFLARFFEVLNIEFTLENTLSLIAASFILKGALVFGSYIFSARLRGRLLFKLKYNLLTGVQQLKYPIFQTKDVGTLAALVNEQVTKVILTFNFFLHFTTHILTSILYLIAGMLASAVLGLFGSLMAILVFILFRKLSANLKRMSVKNSKLTNQITQTAIEGIHNFKYLKSTNLFGHFNNKIKVFMIEFKKLNIYNGIAEGFVISIREPILATILCVILYTQISMLELAVANSLVAMLLFYRGMNSVFNSQRTWQNLLEHSGSIDVIDGELREFEDYSETVNNGVDLPYDWSDIIFNRVTYRLPSDNKLVLKDVSFTIKRNSLTVIMGTSGSGKTTLVDILVGLLKPSSGNIMIGGVDTSRVNLASLRSKIGYVSQDAVAFSDTIANNVSSWNIDNDCSEVQMTRLRAACEKAKILDVICGLRNGFQTELGDRGTTFSGGQRQRLFLAREIYREPEILILDESTSALDSETERLVFDAVSELKGKTTIICITHRASLAEKADNIVNLSKELL